MNHWTTLSIEFANQRNYLDELYRVYAIVPDKIRNIDEDKWADVEKTFDKNNEDFLKALLELPLFPIKDSYVAYLKRDRNAIARNPKTVSRICATPFSPVGTSEW